MELKRLTIDNFRNITSARLDFSPKVNCFLGNNGMGKSNLLDAIYYLSFCKSFSGVSDSMVIKRGEDFLMARGDYRRGETDEQLQLAISRNKRKSLKRGGKEYQRLSAHIGLFPLVMVAPTDIDLIRGAADERRRWLDIVISQSDSIYLDRLIRYGHGLEQRNKMLRDHIVDHTLYEVVELQMDAAATYIAAARKKITDEINTLFQRFYAAIAGPESEEVKIGYAAWNSPRPDATVPTLIECLDSARRHDEVVGHTSVGPHRDDLSLWLNGMDARRAGSQGQCKTFTIAMRLAQFTFLQRAKGLKPLLLLDDIFDKLDASRVERIMQLVTSDDFGQIFVTDTNRTHLNEIMSHTSGNYRLWSVDHGRFTYLAGHDTTTGAAEPSTQPQK